MAASRYRVRRRLLAYEVVQTSAMDCGPASLKCLLEGFGIPVSYGRLREACQTDVDGASIDVIEEVAVQLGLEAEQIMLPHEDLFLSEAQALPALAVTRHPNGATHFVVIWRLNGRSVQIMDPATGRRWIKKARFLHELYSHTLAVPAADWRDWAGSEKFLSLLRRRMFNMGVSSQEAGRLITEALEGSGWRSLATLDATVRMIDSLVKSGGIKKGPQAANVLKSWLQEDPDETGLIPASYWSVRPAPPAIDGEQQLYLRGAVLITVRGRRTAESGDETERPAPLSRELAAALEERSIRPWQTLLRMLRADGLLAPAIITAALAVAACSVTVEALLFQALFHLGQKLSVAHQRLGAAALLISFSLAFLLLELPLAASMFRLGRKLETRLRMAFLEKLPRIEDRYFQSRLISDMADRSHNLQVLRILPTLGGRFLRLIFEILFTTSGIIWLNPEGAPVTLVIAIIALSIPLLIQRRLIERDLRVRNHNGALSRFYFDALLGLIAVRTHGAERAIRREHESLLVEWMHASLGLVQALTTVEVVQTLVGFSLTAWLVLDYLAHGSGAGGVLLLAYWSLNLPVLGQEVALIAQQYPAHRNVTLRFLEPLGAPEEASVDNEVNLEPRSESETSKENLAETVNITRAVDVEPVIMGPTNSAQADKILNPNQINSDGISRATRLSEYECKRMPPNGVRIEFESVSVRAAGHLILEDIDLEIEAGSHVAIVGPSGAGKSTLVGILLGWHRASTGTVLVDGQLLGGRRFDQLRRATAWVDPAVQLWNRSLSENLSYGTPIGNPLPIGSIVAEVNLRQLLEKLPDGLQTAIGEGGGLLSGGEGQRVRLGRAMLRPGIKLVILDEPFRGLDGNQRSDLLSRSRDLWSNATVLCITHDLKETMKFDRVLVLKSGRILEDGRPIELSERPNSHYRSLLDAEMHVRRKLWESTEWRRLELNGGKLADAE